MDQNWSPGNDFDRALWQVGDEIDTMKKCQLEVYKRFGSWRTQCYWRCWQELAIDGNRNPFVPVYGLLRIYKPELSPQTEAPLNRFSNFCSGHQGWKHQFSFLEFHTRWRQVLLAFFTGPGIMATTKRYGPLGPYGAILRRKNLSHHGNLAQIVGRMPPCRTLKGKSWHIVWFLLTSLAIVAISSHACLCMCSKRVPVIVIFSFHDCEMRACYIDKAWQSIGFLQTYHAHDERNVCSHWLLEYGEETFLLIFSLSWCLPSKYSRWTRHV